MRTSTITVAAALAALALAAPAGADVNNGSDCSYAQTEEVSETSGPVVVYAGTGGDAGMTGTALVVAGVCTNGLATGGPVWLDGGAVEAGAGTPAGSPAGYAIVDGDNQNSDPTGETDGYAGVSNYETGAKGSCNGGGSGSNSGGCFSIDGVAQFPVPLIACGNTSGNTWSTTARDGCTNPPDWSWRE